MTLVLLGEMAKRKRIDYSKFALAKTVPIRSPKHLAYIRTFPCSECKDTEDIQAQHWMGEQPYWTERKLDPKIYAALLWDSFNKKELNNG